MAKIYYRKIKEGEINQETGKPWSINDVPERWRQKVQELLDADHGTGV